MDTSRASDLRSRRSFLRSIAEQAVRSGCEMLQPLGSRVAAVTRDDERGPASDSEEDRVRADEWAMSGEVVAALNDLSGIYES